MKSSRLKFQTRLKIDRLLAQHTHRIFQAFERQRKHAVTDQLLDDADALAVFYLCNYSLAVLAEKVLTTDPLPKT